MADFVSNCTDDHVLDLRKRVNYELGMVLGEDDFRQEQAYLRARDHRGVRALHGYGTVAGLAVTLNASGEVEVAPGLAVDPVGRFICVPRPQCADLDRWLRDNEDDILATTGSTPTLPATVEIWVEICFRECLTDEVPVPSEDCRPAGDARVPSRILDSYELRFSLEPPPEVGETAGTGLEESISRLLEAAASVPSEPSGDLEAIRNELLQWVTVDRPEIAAAPCLDTDECCVELVRIDVPVDDLGSGLVATGPPVFDDAQRPILLSTRYLQEWLMAVAAGQIVVGPGPGPSPVPDLGDLGDVNTVGVNAGQTITLDPTGIWVPTNMPDLTGVIRVGDAAGGDLSGTYPDPTVDFSGVVVDGDAAGGDLSGTYPNPTVDGLQGRVVAPTAPNNGDALIFSGGAWRPQPPPAGGGPPIERLLPFATIVAQSPRSFVVWFNLDMPTNRIEVVEPLLVDQQHLVVRRETNGGPNFLVRVPFTGASVPNRNVYTVVTSQAVPLLRFTFDLERIMARVGGGAPAALADIVATENLTFVGQDGQNTVTVFEPNERALG